MTTLNRTFAGLEIRSATVAPDGERVLTGVASTGELDRQGDIVEPLGLSFPSKGAILLWQHKADAPIGRVQFGRPTAKGLPFTARIIRVDQPGPLKDRSDEAWVLASAGVIDSVSIGFRPIKSEPLPGGGLRWTQAEVLELSLVSVGANASAEILQTRAAAAQKAKGRVVRLKEPVSDHVLEMAARLTIKRQNRVVRIGRRRPVRVVRL